MKRSGQLKRGKWKNYAVRMERKPRAKLRSRSKKTASRERKAADVRRRWKNEANGRCMVCRHGPHDPNPEYMPSMAKLVGHEISNGPDRQRSLDKPFCVLIACRGCNEIKLVDKAEWPEARQLACLKKHAPERYDLQAYLHHTRPTAMQRITQEEVDAYLETIES